MELNQNTQQATVSAAAQAAAQSGPKQFGPEEIAELSVIREAYEQITLSLGQLEMQKREVAKNEKRINERLVSVENQEKVFLDKVLSKYGEGTFDVMTGVFTPKK